MKLSSPEKNFVDKISAISGHDVSTVRDIFFSLLIATTLEAYTESNESNEIHIPYLFKILIKCKTEKVNPDKKAFQLKEEYEIETSNSLHEILVKIMAEDWEWVEGFLKKEIMQKINTILDIDLLKQ